MDTETLSRREEREIRRQQRQETKARLKAKRRKAKAQANAYLTPERRARIFPYTTAAATVSIGEILHHTPLPPITSFAGTALIGSAIWATKHDKITTKRQRAYAATALAYAGVWSTAIAGFGLSWRGPGDALLLAGAIGLAAPWARRHLWRWKPRTSSSVSTADSHVFSPSEVTWFEQIWNDAVACTNGPLPGITLSNITPIHAGYQGDIELPPGQKTTSEVLALAERLQSAYRKPATQCHVEEPPTGERNRARIIVLERDVLARGRTWQGRTLDPETGKCIVGSFPDGEHTHWQFWIPGSGAVHGFVAGAIGTGKSRFLDKLLCEQHLSPYTVSWVIDPQEGQSLPDWTEAVDRVGLGENGDLEACIRVLRAALRVMTCRARYLGHLRWVDDKGRERTGLGSFTPTPQMPQLCITIDEAPMLLQSEYGPEALHILGRLAKESRKDGISITLVGQLPSLEELGGSAAQAIRSMLRQGNVASFRTGESVSTYMLGLPGDPSKLPAVFTELDETTGEPKPTQGLGLISGCDQRGATFRAEYVEDPYDVACQPAAGQLDAMSAEAADEGANTHATGTTVVSMTPSAKDREEWSQRILRLLADGNEWSFGEIFKHFYAEDPTVSDRSIRFGLRKLCDEGLIATAGDRMPYQITDLGKQRLAA